MTKQEFEDKWRSYILPFDLKDVPDQAEVVHDLHELGYDGVLISTAPGRLTIVNLNVIHVTGLLYDYFSRNVLV